MCLIRQNLISKDLLFALALYLLNSSVDFQDQRIANYKEDIAINEIESFAELIIEELVCVDNFFEEQTESESEPTTIAASPLNYLVPNQLILPINPVDVASCFYTGDSVFYYFTDFSILTPPPQRV